MMKPAQLLVLFLFSGIYQCYAQGVLKGNLSDSATGTPAGLATVTVFKATDTTIITYRLSDADGNFKIPNLPLGIACRMVVSYSGYAGYRKEFVLSADSSTYDAGKIKLQHTAGSLEEVIVFAERPPVVIKKDTVEFNAAAFKTLPNALVEDLLKKLPGVQVDRDGNIMVNGKPVNRILVDGKTFFGDDPKMATRNLPANAIEKVQVVDDKEEMLRNGNDDLTNVGKVVNITLKKSVKKGWFGKLYAGGGTDERYEAGGIANVYRDTLQVSVLGYANNLNKPGFSYGELMQTGGLDRTASSSSSTSINRSSSSNGSSITVNGVNFGGMQNGGGIATSKGIGFNLNHSPNAKRSLFAQYFYGNVQVSRLNLTDINQYNGDTIINNNKHYTGTSVSNAHSAGIGARLKPDSVTNILLNANFVHGDQLEQRYSDVLAVNNKTGLLSTGNIIQSNPSKTDYYRQIFSLTKLSKSKKGRRLNLYHELSYNNRKNDYGTESLLHYYNPSPFDSVLAQVRLERIPRLDALLHFNYSEPLTKQFTARIGGRYEYSNLHNTTGTFNRAPGSDKYDVQNDLLSSNFKRVSNRFYTTAGLEFKRKDLTITPGVQALFQSVRNDLASLAAPVQQRQNNLLPVFNLLYKKLSFNYSKTVVLPAYNYLLPVSDNTDPYFVTQGNTALLPAKRNNFSINYNNNNTKKNLFMSVYANSSFINNDVVQQIVLSNAGVQTITPVNANGSKSYSINYNINKQYKNNQKLIFSWNIGGWYGINSSKLLFNGEATRQTTYNFNNWMGVNFNFKDKLEFNMSFDPNFNFTRYKSNAFNDINVHSRWWDNELIIRYIKHVAFETQLNVDYTSSVTAGLPKSIVRWNAAINVTALKSEALVFRLSVFDILKSNLNINSFANRNMLTTTQTNPLSQYGMLTATYNVRPMAAKKNSGKSALF
jgi:outer membrane receptor protein involved in Fe transport